MAVVSGAFLVVTYVVACCLLTASCAGNSWLVHSNVEGTTEISIGIWNTCIDSGGDDDDNNCKSIDQMEEWT